MRIQKGLVQVLPHENGGFHSVLGFIPLLLGRLLRVLEEGATGGMVLHLQEVLGALVLLLG